MYCANCGKEMPDGARMCPTCGMAREDGKKTATASEKVMTVGEWFVTLLLTWIPIVGFVMMIVWGFGNGGDPARKNWARANLIWTLVGIVATFVLGASLFKALLDVISALG